LFLLLSKKVTNVVITNHHKISIIYYGYDIKTVLNWPSSPQLHAAMINTPVKQNGQIVRPVFAGGARNIQWSAPSGTWYDGGEGRKWQVLS
jgi:hypothetical protein